MLSLHYLVFVPLMNMPPLNVVTTDLRRNGHVEEADLAPVMSSEEVHLPRDRDGNIKPRFVYARRDLSGKKVRIMCFLFTDIPFS